MAVKGCLLMRGFFVGGDFTVRGYMYGYAGPLAPNTNDPVGAKREVIFSIEANYPLS